EGQSAAPRDLLVERVVGDADAERRTVRPHEGPGRERVAGGGVYGLQGLLEDLDLLLHGAVVRPTPGGDQIGDLCLQLGADDSAAPGERVAIEGQAADVRDFPQVVVVVGAPGRRAEDADGDGDRDREAGDDQLLAAKLIR